MYPKTKQNKEKTGMSSCQFDSIVMIIIIIHVCIEIIQSGGKKSFRTITRFVYAQWFVIIIIIGYTLEWWRQHIYSSRDYGYFGTIFFSWLSLPNGQRARWLWLLLWSWSLCMYMMMYLYPLITITINDTCIHTMNET